MFGRMKFLLVIPLILILCGCSVVLQKRNPDDLEKIDTLSSQLEQEKLARQQLLDAKKELEEKLKKEIEEKQIKLEMMNKGLVITFIDEILFDSGKAVIRSKAAPILDSVANVLQKEVVDRKIAVEGHTDNQPIKKSNWKSNWELSTARATSVLHYLVDEKGLDPSRFVVIGYGEYKPVASNDTTAGRQQNRRVEITILPDKLQETRDFSDQANEKMPEEEIK